MDIVGKCNALSGVAIMVLKYANNTSKEETGQDRAGVAEPHLKIWDRNLGQKFGTDK